MANPDYYTKSVYNFYVSVIDEAGNQSDNNNVTLSIILPSVQISGMKEDINATLNNDEAYAIKWRISRRYE